MNTLLIHKLYGPQREKMYLRTIISVLESIGRIEDRTGSYAVTCKVNIYIQNYYNTLVLFKGTTSTNVLIF